MVNPYFNGQYYLTNNPDVAAAYGLSTAAAEQHYLNYGAGEALSGAAPSRKPAPWFDIKYYLDHNPDLVDAGLNANDLFTHFTTYGMLEGRSPNADIETITEAKLLAYAMGNEDLRDAFGIDDGATSLTDAQEDALTQHFYQYGYTEGRPAPLFGSSEAGDNGQTFELTSGTDRMEGTAGDDHFDAFLAQNPTMGNMSNTLSSADHLKGGAGQDSLFAELIAETPGTGTSTLATQPRTNSIETIEIEARDFGTTQAFDVEFGLSIGLSREAIDTVLEFFADGKPQREDYVFSNDEDVGNGGSYYFDKETYREDLLEWEEERAAIDEIIGEVQGVLGGITFGVDGSITTGRGQAVLDAKHMYGIERIGSKDSDGHLKIQNLNTLMNDGETKRNTDAITITMDHTDNVDSVGEASDLIVYFDENYLISGERSEGQAFYWLLDQDSDEVGGPLLYHIDVDGIGFKIDGGETIVVASAEANAADNHEDFVAALNARLTVMIANDEAPEGTTIFLDYDNTRTTYLDNGAISSAVPAIVVQSGDGSPVTPIGYNKPSDQTGEYNVWARFSSEYEVEGQPISTNIELLKAGRGGEGGDLIVGGKDVVDGKGIEVFNVKVMGDESKPSHIAALNSTAGALRTVNVTTDENVTGDKGYADLTIGNLGGAYQNVGGRLVPENDVQNFDSTSFKGDLTMSTRLDESGNGQHIYKFGAGDNTLNIELDDFGGIAHDSLSVSTGVGDDHITIWGDGADLESLVINAGDGDNTIFFDTFNSNLFTDGEGARIVSGSGNDAIYLNDGESTFLPLILPAGTPQTFKMFGAKMQVSVDGVQSQWVDINYDTTAFTTSRADIRQAIQDAVDSNSALAGMVEIVENTDGTLSARSLVTGGSKVEIDIQGPVASKTDINAVGQPVHKTVFDSDGAGWDLLNAQSHLNQVSVSKMAAAWKAWYPDSVGFDGTGDFSSTNPGDFLAAVNGAGTLLDAMQLTAAGLGSALTGQKLDGPDSNAEGNNVINSGAGDDLIVLNYLNGLNDDGDLTNVAHTGNTVEMTADYFGVNTIVNFTVGTAGSGATRFDDNDILDFTSYLDAAANARGSSVGNKAARIDEAVRYSVDDLNWALFDNTGANGFDHNSINTGNFGEIWTAAGLTAKPANFDALSASDMSTYFNNTGGFSVGDFVTGSGGGTQTALGNNFLVLVAKNGDTTIDSAGALTFDWLDGNSGSAADEGVFKVFEGKVTQFDATSTPSSYHVDFTERGTIDLAEVDVMSDITLAGSGGSDVFGF